MTERFDGGGRRISCQGEIEGIGIQGKVFGGWTTRRGERPLPQVKCIRSEGEKGRG